MSFDTDDKSKGRRMMEKYFEHLKRIFYKFY